MGQCCSCQKATDDDFLAEKPPPTAPRPASVSKLDLSKITANPQAYAGVATHQKGAIQPETTAGAIKAQSTKTAKVLTKLEWYAQKLQKVEQELKGLEVETRCGTLSVEKAKHIWHKTAKLKGILDKLQAEEIDAVQPSQYSGQEQVKQERKTLTISIENDLVPRFIALMEILKAAISGVPVVPPPLIPAAGLQEKPSLQQVPASELKKAPEVAPAKSPEVSQQSQNGATEAGIKPENSGLSLAQFSEINISDDLSPQEKVQENPVDAFDEKLANLEEDLEEEEELPDAEVLALCKVYQELIIDFKVIQPDNLRSQEEIEKDTNTLSPKEEIDMLKRLSDCEVALKAVMKKRNLVESPMQPVDDLATVFEEVSLDAA